MSSEAPSACPTCGREVPPDALTCPDDGTDLAATLEKTGRRDPIVGLTLGEYRVEERIGVGGMGIVYRAVHPLIGKSVAIKVLRPDLARDPAVVQRLLEEARAVNAVGHRGIIDVFGFGQLPLEEGRQYMVMEYLNGAGLDAVLHERAPLPPAEALQILDEILAAIDAAHGAGVVHRDLKPSNVFLVKQQGGSFVKILDFGLAKKAAQPRGLTPQTRTDMVVGTPEYMAPEQARGREVGPHTDLYSIGVIAFEMVTGRQPFTGETAFDIAMKHVDMPAPRASSFDAAVPPELDDLIFRLMAKDPLERPRAGAVRAALVRIRREIAAASTTLYQPGTPRPAPPVTSAPSTARVPAARTPPKPVVIAGAAAALLVVGAAAVALLHEREPLVAPPPPPQRAAVAALAAPAPPAAQPEAEVAPVVVAPVVVAPVPVKPQPPPKRASRPAAEKPAAKAPGHLNVKVTGGAWADIRVDGEVKAHGYTLSIDLAPGAHRVVASNPGTDTFDRQITIVSGATQDVEARLTKR